jgi:hypothetical protein
LIIVQREKTSQAFRDALHKYYKSSNHSKKKKRIEDAKSRNASSLVSNPDPHIHQNTTGSPAFDTSNDNVISEQDWFPNDIHDTSSGGFSELDGINISTTYTNNYATISTSQSSAEYLPSCQMQMMGDTSFQYDSESFIDDNFLLKMINDSTTLDRRMQQSKSMADSNDDDFGIHASLMNSIMWDGDYYGNEAVIDYARKIIPSAYDLCCIFGPCNRHKNDVRDA